MKTKDKYDWAVGQPPPTLDPHSQVKHELVYEYVTQYIPILMSNAQMPALTLTLIDGFCGGGQYATDNGVAPGSPLLLMQAVKEAEAAINIGRDKRRSVKAEYHFVDAAKSSIDYLKYVLNGEGHAARVGQDLHLHNGRFDQVCDRIVARVQERKGGARAIFLLDQYAYDDVPFPMVRSIFDKVQGAEVILTFNVDSLISFLSDTPKSRAKMREIGLEQYIDWDICQKDAKDANWRPLIQQQLSNAIWKASGAKFMTLFFIRPLGKTPWSYWLVHLSNKFRARDEMMALHWKRGNSFGHSLDPGLFKIGYEAGGDEKVTGQQGLSMGDAHEFDTILRERCVATLSEALPRLIYAAPEGMPFSELMLSITNHTAATSDLVRESLDVSVKTGDIVVRSEDGSARVKGASIGESDIIVPSRQQSIFLVNPPLTKGSSSAS